MSNFAMMTDSELFGFFSDLYKEKVGRYSSFVDELYVLTEKVMDEIILNAVKEQKPYFDPNFEKL